MKSKDIIWKLSELRNKLVSPSIECVTPDGLNMQLADSSENNNLNGDGCTPTCSPCLPCRPDDRPMQCSPLDQRCYPDCNPCSPCYPCEPTSSR